MAGLTTTQGDEAQNIGCTDLPPGKRMSEYAHVTQMTPWQIVKYTALA